MFNAIIKTETLSDALDSINVLVDECKIRLQEDGISIRAVDPANVGMVDMEIDESGFESFQADEGVIAISLETLQDAISMGSSDDLVHLELDEETRKLNVEVNNVSYTLALIDPDSVREEPDIPDLDLPVEVTVEGNELIQGINAGEMVSDHCTIEFDTDDSALTISSEGDTDTVDYSIPQEDMISCSSGEAKSLFSLDYLGDMKKALPKKGEVTIVVGEEFPTKMHYQQAEGSTKITYMLAPRIQSE